MLENARWKAASISAIEPRPGTLVIAGDTEVALDGRALGQAEDEAEARRHLETPLGPRARGPRRARPDGT